MAQATTETVRAGTPALKRRDWIAGLDKGLTLLEAFDDANPRMSATQAGQHCGLTRTAARRYLLTLVQLGYLASDGKLFWTTPRVLRLGQTYLESARLPRVAQPFLQRVAAGTHENAYLSVLDGFDVIYIAHSGPIRALNIGYVLGARVQAQVTAAGMLLLALGDGAQRQEWLDKYQPKAFTSHTMVDTALIMRELERIRHQGWALSEQQLELNYRGVAVPLRDRHGDMLGALSITMPIGRESSQDALGRVLGVLRETAQAMRNIV